MVLDKIHVMQGGKLKFALEIWGKIWYNNSVVGRDTNRAFPAGPGEREKEGAKMAERFPITVTFRNGQIRHYSSDTLQCWMNDPQVYEIVRSDNGEILFYD